MPPSLSISKSDSKDPVLPGELLNYTITIKNEGGLPAYNVSVIEQYDANFEFISSLPSPSIGNNIWNLGTINPGETRTIKIYGKVLGGEYIYNIVSFTSSNGGNGFVVEQTRVIYPSIGIRKEAPAQVNAGSLLTYNITYFNPSEVDLTNVIIKENYPSHASFINAYPYPTIGNDTWIIGKLAAKSSATITIILKVDSPLPNGTLLLNNVSINCSQNVSAYATATTLVISSPSLSIDKQDSIDPVTAGDWLNYTILISNNGNDDARNVIVEDTFNELLEIIECNGTINGNKITWNIPLIKAGDTIILEIKAKVKPIDYETTIYNNVELRCIESIASDNESTKVNPPPIMAYPRIEIEKSAPEQVIYSSEFKYEIIVRNIGDASATNVTVKDMLADGLIFIKAIPDASINGNELTWKFDKILAGEIKIIEIYVKAIKTGSILNKANVTYDGLYDEDECIVNVIPDVAPPSSRKVFYGPVKNVTFFGSYIIHYIPVTTYIKLASIDDVGVAHTYYRIWKWNESIGKWILCFNWKEYKGEKIYLFNLAGYGKYEIEFYSVDIAGNIEEIEYNDVIVYS
ncbi:MAG: hypothetical protein QW762_04300 [Candidatus Thermoplasmatota archaeon]